MELHAELTARDDSRRPFRVSCEQSLPGLLRGLEQLKEAVSAELSELVLREKGEKTPGGDGCEQGDAAEDDDDDDDDDDRAVESESSRNGPPAKRTKTRQR